MGIFSDEDFYIYNVTDTTKQLRFSLAGLTTATIRILTLPNNNGTLAVVNLPQAWSGVQEFTNDGTQAPVILDGLGLSAIPFLRVNDTENLKHGDLTWNITNNRSIAVPNASGTLTLKELAQTWSAPQTFDNSGGSGGAIFQGDSNTPFYNFALQDVGFTGFSTRVRSNPVVAADITVTFPATSTVLIGASTTDTLTNKTIQTLKVATTIFGLPVIAGNGADPPAANFMGRVSKTAQTAAIVATNLTNTCPAGFYVVEFYLETTTANIADGTIAIQINYTDRVGATTQASVGTLALSALTTGTTALSGAFRLFLASGNITYQTNLAGVQTTSRYSLDMRIKHMG